MHPINSLRGKVSIRLGTQSRCSIGNFLMTSGPFYIKCIESSELTIGNKCFFNCNCSITCANKIVIGSNCMFANNFVVVDHDHRIKDGKITANLITQPTFIENNVWCGANVTVVKGVTIGEGAIVAAGSVVTHNVEAHTLVAGVPAKFVKHLQ
ncbi:acyltransferase [Clostridium autoethanogenum]|nr:acyltransferase [Clostridium autoethanogenum]